MKTETMKITTVILSIATIVLGVLAAVVWLLPVAGSNAEAGIYGYGVSEGLQLTRDASGNLVVRDVAGYAVFHVQLRGCVVDTRFRGGRLRFREEATGRLGFVDRHGVVTFNDSSAVEPSANEGKTVRIAEASGRLAAQADGEVRERGTARLRRSGSGDEADLRALAQGNPFYAEAAKILKGKLSEEDAKRRRAILNYCERFRNAYTKKDIGFLRQVFSDKALIIVGNVVREKSVDSGLGQGSRVTYAMHSKKDYLQRLSLVFRASKRIDVRFSDFRIMRHPTMDGIYGVVMRQGYKSDRYEDDGWLFLLWDFRNASMPVIHVRTWQPAKVVGGEDDVIGISDFNLE